MIDFDAKENELKGRFDRLKAEATASERVVKENTEELLRLQGAFRLLAELRSQSQSIDSPSSHSGDK